MATALVDRVSLLEADEEDGVLVRLVRRVYVSGLEADTDYTTLANALATAGVPDNGDSLSGAKFANLIMRNRKVRLLDKGQCEVDCFYERFTNDGQDLDSPFSSAVVGEIRVTVQQKESNTDRDGVPVSVSHTYPSTDEKYPSQTKTQGGKFNFFQPQRSIVLRGVKTTSRPWLFYSQMVGSVNLNPWQGGAARTWMCVGGYSEILSTTNRHRLNFEFQYDPDGWDPTVIFIDDRTGKPPVDLVNGTGYKTIEKHPAVDFEAILGQRISGG